LRACNIKASLLAHAKEFRDDGTIIEVVISELRVMKAIIEVAKPGSAVRAARQQLDSRALGASPIAGEVEPR
jgi:hypothetical protein